MHPKFFAEGIEMISQVFGDTPTKGPRLARIRSLCDGRISGEGFVEICEVLCDNSRYAPLPGDFDKGVVEWRKNFQRIHGRSYSEESSDVIEAQYTVIDCARCNDLGLVRITHRVPSDFECLMKCTCKKLTLEEIAVPEWDPGLSGAYVVGHCPIEWFKPDIKETDPDSKLFSKIMERVLFFQNKKRQAEQHWAKLGFQKVGKHELNKA